MPPGFIAQQQGSFCGWIRHSAFPFLPASGSIRRRAGSIVPMPKGQPMDKRQRISGSMQEGHRDASMRYKSRAERAYKARITDIISFHHTIPIPSPDRTHPIPIPYPSRPHTTPIPFPYHPLPSFTIPRRFQLFLTMLK